jgi:hypothetical protein
VRIVAGDAVHADELSAMARHRESNNDSVMRDYPIIVRPSSNDVGQKVTPISGQFGAASA